MYAELCCITKWNWFEWKWTEAPKTMKFIAVKFDSVVQTYSRQIFQVWIKFVAFQFLTTVCNFLKCGFQDNSLWIKIDLAKVQVFEQ